MGGGASKGKKTPAAAGAAQKAGGGGAAAGAGAGATPAPAAAGFEGQYDVAKVLGKGNYAVVKLCTRKKDKASFAVKVMEKAKLTKEDIDAVAVEVNVLRALKHPNIILLVDTFDEPRFFYIVSELMEGGELFDRIVKRSFYSEADTQKVVRVLADALAYMHKLGYVHRDLKPENILLKDKSEDAALKLADFGFARPVGDGCRTACGTPGYVAPEIISGQKYGTSADCWSLGVITYILLCGYPPFFNANQTVLFRLIRQGKFAFDSPYWDPISASAKDFVKACLTVEVGKRLNMEQIKTHAWVAGVASKADITPALGQLKLFNARRKLRAHMMAIIAANRMSDLTDLAQQLKQGKKL